MRRATDRQPSATDEQNVFVFVWFVYVLLLFQPLDLCSPDRALLMSEEMILHQADLLPAKVTPCKYTYVCIYVCTQH